MAPMVDFGNQTSAWWFYGKLRPEYATGFNVQEVVVEGAVRLEIYHDRIAVWAPASADVVLDPASARELFTLVVGAYSIVSGIPLDWSLDGWVEATDARIGGSVLGAVPDTRGRKRPMKEADEIECKRMRAAAELAVSVRSMPGYRLALRDIYQALLLESTTRSDDAFLFGYRSLVDLARAVSGRDTDELKVGDWDQLAKRLRISPVDLKSRKAGLEKARHAAAHGDERDPDLATARVGRTQLIEDARLFVADTLAAETTLNFDRSLVVESA